MDDSKDGKSKNNKESILRNWKTLKQSIEPVDFVGELVKNQFLPKSSFVDLGSKSRSHQATLVLIKVYRQVQLCEKEYKKLVKILRCYKSTAADALNKAVGGPINKHETDDKLLIEQTGAIMKRFEEKIIDKLKKNPDVFLEILDNFIECGILDIDTVENILHLLNDSQKEKAVALLVKVVIENIHRGAYNLLLEILKSVKKLKGLVSELTTAGVDEDIKTAKPILQERRKDSPDVTREAAGGFTLSINGKPNNPEINRTLLARNSPVDLALYNAFGSTIENKKDGSAIFRFAYGCSKNVNAVKGKIKQGAMAHLMEDITKHMDCSDLMEMSQFDVKLSCSNNKISNMSTVILPSATFLSGVIARTQSEQQETESVHHTTESAQHTINVTIIAANKSFLIEEINTMALVRAFQDKGKTCFDGLDGTLGRQQMAERFLTILEENNNLLDQLLDILHEQGMTYVLARLNNYRNAYLTDPQILRPNISNNRNNILDNLDIDNVREIFIEREVISSSMFDEIEKKYSGSEDQMCIVLIEIINSGPRAMRTLVDVLYINQLDSLADSLLVRTSSEMQEMQDNTQTDESSSDGELLYEATYVVSKSDDKSSSDGELLSEATYVVSKSDE